MHLINIKTIVPLITIASLAKQTFKINLYDSNKINIGYVNFNIKKENVFISAIYLFEKFRNQNIFKDYWQIIEKTIIEIYRGEYDKSVIIFDILARELDAKHNKLVGKYKLLGFEVDLKKKERVEYDEDYCYRIVPMQKLIIL